MYLYTIDNQIFINYFCLKIKIIAVIFVYIK